MTSDPEMHELAEAEDPAGTRARWSGSRAELQRRLLPKDPNDERNIFLEIRAGTGGDESALFAGDLFRMYARYAERQALAGRGRVPEPRRDGRLQGDHRADHRRRAPTRG